MNNVKTFGLELEAFLVDKAGEPAAADYNIPHDDFAFLAEARSESHAHAREAGHLLNAAIDRLRKTVTKENLYLRFQDTMNVSKKLIRERLRGSKKSYGSSYFAHGGGYKNQTPRAGLHLHFGSVSEYYSKATSYESGKGERSTYSKVNIVLQVNMPRIIWMLDEAFKEEIRAAKRIPGEYELKPHGFEYRSLPASIWTTKQEKVIATLEKIESDRS